MELNVEEIRYKMSEKQIIRALECLSKPNSSPVDREKCYFMWKEPSCLSCYHEVAQNALALIKQLTQAHEMLSESYDALEKTKDELLAERSRLTEEKERLNTIWAKQCVELEEICMALGAEVADLQDELKCEKETNAHLGSQYMSENHLRHQAEEMLANGMSVVKADTVREMQTRLTQYIGTYTDKSFVYVSAMFKLVDQIAKELIGDE